MSLAATVWKGWKHDPHGFWMHPKLVCVVERWKPGCGGYRHDASKKWPWRTEGARGWIITIGLHSVGIFPTLRDAQRAAQSHPQCQGSAL